MTLHWATKTFDVEIVVFAAADSLVAVADVFDADAVAVGDGGALEVVDGHVCPVPRKGNGFRNTFCCIVSTQIESMATTGRKYSSWTFF